MAAGHKPPTVSVNLSAAQLSEPGFSETVRSAIDNAGLDASRLCLEITESVLMDDVEASIAALTELKALGVRLAIDDFGTGYSSLSYLRRFPVDIVKIDRSFIAAVGLDPAADAIVAAVVNLCHALGLDVVAEGVETDDQLVAIRALRCDRAQGYYWSTALSTQELGEWTEAAQQLVALEPVAVHALLAERIDALQAATRRSIVVELPAKAASVVADPRTLETIFDHLLGNAAAYSADDRPIVVTGASDRRWVRVSIADFGTGMTRGSRAAASNSSGRRRARRGTANAARAWASTSCGRWSRHWAVTWPCEARRAKARRSPSPCRARRGRRCPDRARPSTARGIGEDSSIREFMRQIGVPNRRGR